MTWKIFFLVLNHKKEVSKDRDRLQNELNRLLEELKLKTTSYDSEVKNLKKTIYKNEIELTEASSNIEKLTNSRDRLETEAKTSKSALNRNKKKDFILRKSVKNWIYY